MTNFTPINTGLGYSIIGEYIAHGEVNVIPIDRLPSNIGPAIPTENGMHILGHSESGGHHVLDRVDNIDRYYNPESPAVEGIPASSPLSSYLSVIADDVKLEHLGKGNHGTQDIPAGTYIVTTNREETPEGLRRVAD